MEKLLEKCPKKSIVTNKNDHFESYWVLVMLKCKPFIKNVRIQYC